MAHTGHGSLVISVSYNEARLVWSNNRDEYFSQKVVSAKVTEYFKCDLVTFFYVRRNS